MLFARHLKFPELITVREEVWMTRCFARLSDSIEYSSKQFVERLSASVRLTTVLTSFLFFCHRWYTTIGVKPAIQNSVNCGNLSFSPGIRNIWWSMTVCSRREKKRDVCSIARDPSDSVMVPRGLLAMKISNKSRRWLIDSGRHSCNELAACDGEKYEWKMPESLVIYYRYYGFSPGYSLANWILHWPSSSG